MNSPVGLGESLLNRIPLLKKSWLSWAVAVVVTGGGGVLLWLPIHFTADDYGALVACQESIKPCWDFWGPIFARIPATVLTQGPLLYFGIWESFPRVVLTVYFAIHVVAFALLVSWYIELVASATLDGEATASINPSDRTRAPTWVPYVALGVLALYPSQHEIHLFYSTAVHSLGALFAALGVRTKRLGWRIACYSISALYYETFLLLTAGLEALRFIWGDGRRRKLTDRFVSRIIYAAGSWFFSLALWALTTTLFSTLIGATNRRPLGAASDFFGRWTGLQKMLLVPHFRKDYWFNGLLELTGILLLIGPVLYPLIATSIARKNRSGSRPLPDSGAGRVALKTVSDIGFYLQRSALSIGVPVLFATPLALLPYSAIRSLYGPHLLRQVVLFGLVVVGILGLRRSEIPQVRNGFLSSRARLALGFLFIGLGYVTLWSRILKTKSDNTVALARLENQVGAALSSCSSPCVLEVPSPEGQTSGDWVIHRDYFQAYYERIRFRRASGKEVIFEVNAGLSEPRIKNDPKVAH